MLKNFMQFNSNNKLRKRPDSSVCSEFGRGMSETDEGTVNLADLTSIRVSSGSSGASKVMNPSKLGGEVPYGM